MLQTNGVSLLLGKRGGHGQNPACHRRFDGLAMTGNAQECVAQR